MKRMIAVLGVLLLAAVAVMPSPAKAEMYVEGYLGIAAGSNLGKELNTNVFGFPTSMDFTGYAKAAFQGGMKFGYWFVKEGFLGYNYPDWAKYFGIYTDISYHKVDMGNTTSQLVMSGLGIFPADLATDGYALTWAFMFTARYGFLPDSEVPFGRLQPYIAVGPAIVFSEQSPTIKTPSFAPVFPGIKGDSISSTNLALAVEAGLRYMALKNVSIDASFKWRYFEPRHSFTFLDPFVGATRSITYNPSVNLFSFQVGAAYHF
jgi:opacity protein-like surface antigen